MHQVFGPSPYSAFRLAQFKQKLQEILPSLTGLDCQAGYWWLADDEWSSQDDERLAVLLPGELSSQLQVSGTIVAVVPRFGTISPWSSKATDIARGCGLKIERIEHGRVFGLQTSQPISATQLAQVSEILADRMTESVVINLDRIAELFTTVAPRHRETVELLSQGIDALHHANDALGLALSQAEIEYLYANFSQLKRNPSYAELMMFAQVNSEHCRHKIFNAQWTIDGEPQDKSLFAMIRNTHKNYSEGVLSAYSDNSAVITGQAANWFFPDSAGEYQTCQEPMHIAIKVETHNHPTAIAPHAGAATGSGGEIRDEGATGRGARPKAGLCGFSVSDLHIPDAVQPWEVAIGRPSHVASALQIMTDGPIGAAAFNNEFGRPNLAGYFRTLTIRVGDQVFGYHKPIMIAGGLGNVRDAHVLKQPIEPGMALLVLGGPAMLIGLGGGAASSQQASDASAELDFASVQRANPEMERRAQQVINHCLGLGDANPIVSIHDVGAGGLSNALPELVNDWQLGGQIELRAIPNAEPGMSPMEIWCNEAQERYVLALKQQDVPQLQDIAERERCPIAVMGMATEQPQLVVTDAMQSAAAIADTITEQKTVTVSDTDQESVSASITESILSQASLEDEHPVDIPMATLFAKPPRLQKDVTTKSKSLTPIDTKNIDISDAIERVISHPTVASKQFLITIGDRTVTGLVARDQMVGPWQVPVADVAVTAASYQEFHGEAMAMGERTPVAIIDAAAAARVAVGEAITNILAADIKQLSDIKLSANWMAACGEPGEDAALYAAVQAVGMELCPALNITIPVGKDSLSMRMKWQQDNQSHSVTAPVSLIVSAFAPVTDIRNTLTPQLRTDQGDTQLLLIDLGQGRLGGSILGQVFDQIGAVAPDVDNPQLLQHLWSAVRALHHQNLLLAYHDRSDGGLLATLCEMSFAGHVGLDIQLQSLGSDPLRSLCNEELGVVLQVRTAEVEQVMAILSAENLHTRTHVVATLNDSDTITVHQDQSSLYSAPRFKMQQLWSTTSYRVQALRDNSECAAQEFTKLSQDDDRGLFAQLTFDAQQDITAPYVNVTKPAVAILREQGVNGQVEMAAAFDCAQFRTVDVHMQDVLSGQISLQDFHGLAACGGFSFGDVLGAGRGWANSILFNPRARQEFSEFFQRDDTFALGVCNGCQMLSHLRELIPGTEHWPTFARNVSEQFEARLSLVHIESSPSILLQDMSGTVCPIAVAHGEGQAVFTGPIPEDLIVLRYVDAQGLDTTHYPDNPNGSPAGISGLTTPDGRVTIMMPHPERVFRTVQYSWHPEDWGSDSPWLRLFRNARRWLN